MCRHGVPYTTRFQFCQSHLQLARTFFKYVVNNQLVDNAVVAFFHLSCRERICFQRTFASVDGDQLSFVLLVGSSGVDIEFCRFAGIFALESNFLLASAYIQCIFEVQRIFLAVNSYDTFAANVDNTQFATFEEILSFQRIDSFKYQLFCCRYGTTEDEAVVHGISHVDLIRNHYFFHQEATTQAVCIIRFHVLRIASHLHLVIYLGRSRHSCDTHHHCNC